MEVAFLPYVCDRRWKRASAEVDDVVKPVTHKLKRKAPALQRTAIQSSAFKNLRPTPTNPW